MIDQQNGEGSAKAGQRQQVRHRQEQCYWGSASRDSSSKDGFSKDCAYKGSTGKNSISKGSASKDNTRKATRLMERAT